MYSTAPQDGTVLGTLEQNIPLTQVMGRENVRFNVDEFNYLGNLSATVSTAIAWHTTGIKTIEDAKQKELIVGATGVTGTTELFPRLINRTLGNLTGRVVVRADSSGTSFVFSKHLSEVDNDFNTSVGANTMPNWPIGTKSKGNEGVTAALMSTPGSIGYIEYGYAKSQGLAMAELENKAGEYIAASTASGQAALASMKLPESMIAWAPDPEGAQAYPIGTYTWLILYKQYKDPRKLEILRELVKYSVSNGQQSSEALGYIPLPDAVVEQVKAAVENVKLAANAS